MLENIVCGLMVILFFALIIGGAYFIADSDLPFWFKFFLLK